jgi:hypothetical protein
VITHVETIFVKRFTISGGVYVSRKQVQEQLGEQNLIGPHGMGTDFDMYLYEYMGHQFLERDIGSEKFWKSREDVHVHQIITSLRVLGSHCERVIGKLEVMLRIKKNIEDPHYIPMPGDVLFVSSVTPEENIQGIAIEGGIATVLDVDNSGRVFFYSFPEIPFRIQHLMKNQMAWMNTYGFESARRIDPNDDEAPEIQNDERVVHEEPLINEQDAVDFDNTGEDDEDEGEEE